jgi:hypothetical protein
MVAPTSLLLEAQDVPTIPAARSSISIILFIVSVSIFFVLSPIVRSALPFVTQRKNFFYHSYSLDAAPRQKVSFLPKKIPNKPGIE